MTPSIIVYRNPLEQWFWEGDGALFVLGLLVGVVILAWLYGLAQEFYYRVLRWRRTGRWKRETF